MLQPGLWYKLVFVGKDCNNVVQHDLFVCFLNTKYFYMLLLFYIVFCTFAILNKRYVKCTNECMQCTASHLRLLFTVPSISRTNSPTLSLLLSLKGEESLIVLQISCSNIRITALSRFTHITLTNHAICTQTQGWNLEFPKV